MICETITTTEYSSELEFFLDTVRDQPLRYCRYAVNRGVGLGRNMAVSECEGDWILMLDSDDLLEKDSIKSLVMGMNHDTVMVYGDHARRSIDLHEVRYARRKALYHKLLREHSMNTIYTPLCSSIFSARVR